MKRKCDECGHDFTPINDRNYVCPPCVIDRGNQKRAAVNHELRIAMRKTHVPNPKPLLR